MWDAGLKEVEAYILRRHNKVAQYIKALLILDLCEEALRRPGMCVSKRWWEQEGLDLERAQSVSEVSVER